MRGAGGGDAEPLGDPGTAPNICLQHVDGTGFEHALEVHEVVAVLAGGDIERQRLA